MNEPYLLTIPPRPDLSRPPRFLIENYSGMEQEMEGWLFSYYFWQFWDRQPDSLENVTLRARSSADARFKVLTQSNAIRGASERSVIYQLYQAQKTGWYRFVNEMADVRELIEAMYQDVKEDEDSGKRYELEFILKTLLPTLEQLGVAKELIVGIPTNISKARAAVSTLRQMIAVDGPGLKDNMEEVLRDIPNPEVTVRDFRERNRKRLGKTEPPKPVPASVYLLAGTELIVIESDRLHTQTIEAATRGIAEGYMIRDGTNLLKELAQRILPKSEDMQRLRLQETSLGYSLGRHPEGLLLPSPSAFQQRVIEEAAHQRFVLRQVLPDPVSLPVHLLSQRQGFDASWTWLAEQLGQPHLGPAEIQMAFDSYYRTVPAEIGQMFPRATGLIALGWAADEETLALYLILKEV